MDQPEAHEAALRIILNDENLNLLNFSQTEKELRTAPWLRSIRLDVFALDERHTVYDTEMQGEYRKDLVKRSRYYQGLIDSSLLEPGSVDFNSLNETYIIMIMPFDLFGKGKYCYTFRSYCEEDKDIFLNDGATRIFLNTNGKNEDEVSKELIDFLHYIECTEEAVALKSGSENIKKIHECVKRIKSSEEMGVKYMQTWEEKILDRQKGRTEGEMLQLISLIQKKVIKEKSLDVIADELEETTENIQSLYMLIQNHLSASKEEIYEYFTDQM